MLQTVAVRGYRSLREVVLPLGRLSVVTGANGAGKSSLYRALRLLADCGRHDAGAPDPGFRRGQRGHRHRAVEIELYKEWGEARIVGQGLLTTPRWDWGKR